jgi:hypothetical protein
VDYIECTTDATAVPLVADILDERVPANEPVTGQAMTVAIRRLSDNKWWDFVALAWDTFTTYALIEASNKAAMTDSGDGSYFYLWNHHAADPGATADYVAVYCVPSGTWRGMQYALLRFAPDVVREDVWTDARGGYQDELAGANMPADLDTVKGYTDLIDDETNGLAAIRAALLTAAGVADLDLATYEATAKSGTKLGEMIAGARAWGIGRLAISGTTLTLYEADGVTVICTFALASDYSTRSAPA